MGSTRARPGPSVVLFVVVAAALAIGAAASLIAGAASAPAFHAGPASELVVPNWVIGAVIISLFALVVAVVLYLRFGSGPMRLEARYAVTALAVLLLGILFVALLHFGSGAGGLQFGGGGGAGGGGGSGNGTGGANLTGPGGQLTFLSLNLPPWALFVAVAATLLAVGAVAIPRAWAYAHGRRRERGAGRRRSAEVDDVLGALAVAAQQLEQGSEPRAVIIALYASVLERVGPMVGGLDAETPEEIRALHLVRLGIRASAAERLTRLFEEARYSSHPMGPEAAVQAGDAIREARDDLDRLPRPA
jgi:hypothetical protein